MGQSGKADSNHQSQRGGRRALPLSYFRFFWMIACPAPASNERGLPKGVGLFSFDTRGAGMWGGGSRHHILRITQTALTDVAPIKVLKSFIQPAYGCLFVFFHVRSPRRVADANAPVTVYALSIVNVLGAPANGNPADRSFGSQRDYDRMRLAGSIETIRVIRLCRGCRFGSNVKSGRMSAKLSSDVQIGITALVVCPI